MLGLVQSARIATTLSPRSWSTTGARSSTSVLLALHVRHQSAVTSTKTVFPCDTSFGISERSNATQSWPTALVCGGIVSAVGTRRLRTATTTSAVGRVNLPGKRIVARRMKRLVISSTVMATRPPATPISTQSSQIAVPARRPASTHLTTTIQRPGLGNNRTRPGFPARTR